MMAQTALDEIGNLDMWFEALDGFTGLEANRSAWLATQWSVYGEEADWNALRADAELVIAEWRKTRPASSTTINDVAALVCADIARRVA
jgi:hypothetical protein